MFDYNWNIKDGYPSKNASYHGTTVFSTFACGGGSTMGYKLAGFDVVAANDIDPKMQKVYEANHHPKKFYFGSIKDLLKRDDLPKVDLLDGSPPCSVFSMAGSREKAWQKDKVFREGQSSQILDDLFFDFIDLAERMKPKYIVAENVKGMLMGNAKGYLVEIKQRLDKIGYSVQLFLLNAASMGVPQQRERVLFLCKRKELNLEKIKLKFETEQITLLQMEKRVKNILGKELSKSYKIWWSRLKGSGSFSKVHPKGSFFNTHKCSPYQPLNTITATSGAKLTHYNYPNELSVDLLCSGGSFPQDYNFSNIDPKYLIGMSVPPVMMANVAQQVYEQWIKV